MGHRAAIIGVGAPPDSDGPGFAMGYTHADAYTAADVPIVGCADLDSDNARAFCDAYDLDTEQGYADHNELLDAERPSIVSICTPPATHAAIVSDCATYPAVEAIHCEKPMARTWAECREMVDVCEREGVTLTFNHMRRLSPPVQRAQQLIADGAIGELRRVEFSAVDLYDYGTHNFDLCGCFVEESPPASVLAGLDGAIEDLWGGAYNHHNEGGAVVQWRYENGVHGLATTGQAAEATDTIGCHNRLIGTDGSIELGPDDADVDLRIRQDESWETVETAGSLHDGNDAAIADLVDALEHDREPELSGQRALNATALIFGAWESARRNERVAFPLEIEDNPLEAMVESGTLPVLRNGAEEN